MSEPTQGAGETTPKEIETAVTLINSAQRCLALIRDNDEVKRRLEKALHDALVFLQSTKMKIVPVALKDLEDALGDKQVRIIECLKDEDLREAWQAIYIAAHHYRKRMLYEDRSYAESAHMKDTKMHDWNRMKEILTKSWKYPSGDRIAAKQAEQDRRSAMKEAIAICEKNLSAQPPEPESNQEAGGALEDVDAAISATLHAECKGVDKDEILGHLQQASATLRSASRPAPVSDGVRDALYEALHAYRCQYTHDDNADGAPLIDLLSPGDTVEEGGHELRLLADYLADRLDSPSPQVAQTSGEAREVEAIYDSLNSYRCQYTQDADGDGLPLIDILSPGDTTEEGGEEMHLLAEHLSDTLRSRKAQGKNGEANNAA